MMHLRATEKLESRVGGLKVCHLFCIGHTHELQKIEQINNNKMIEVVKMTKIEENNTISRTPA